MSRRARPRRTTTPPPRPVGAVRWPETVTILAVVGVEACAHALPTTVAVSRGAVALAVVAVGLAFALVVGALQEMRLRVADARHDSAVNFAAWSRALRARNAILRQARYWRSVARAHGAPRHPRPLSPADVPRHRRAARPLAEVAA